MSDVADPGSTGKTVGWVYFNKLKLVELTGFIASIDLHSVNYLPSHFMHFNMHCNSLTGNIRVPNNS